MINFEYFCLPALYVKDISSDVIHMVGTDAHDRLYLDANGNIQYLNLQSGGGTPDDYSFVLDEDGHNQNNLPFSKKEQLKDYLDMTVLHVDQDWNITIG